MPSRRPYRPREGPAREKAESALNDKKTPKINNWIRNSPITGFKTHLQNQSCPQRFFAMSLATILTCSGECMLSRSATSAVSITVAIACSKYKFTARLVP